jgi:hypothetical protein
MRFNEENLLESYLRSLESPLRDLIASCDDDNALRTFACSCARAAMDYAKVKNGDLTSVLSIADAFVDGKADRAQLDKAALEAERLVDMFEAEENLHYETATEQLAFNAARVAYAVYACTAESARCAAAFSCYEAETVLDASSDREIRPTLEKLAMEILRPSADR